MNLLSLGSEKYVAGHLLFQLAVELKLEHFNQCVRTDLV